MKNILIVILFIFTACSAPKSYILNSIEPIKSNKNFNYSIGVKDIELPQYLQTKKIPYLENGNQLKYLKDKKWATYLDEQLTNRIISTLQKALNTPKIYKYPQNSPTKTDIILQITINKFIANNHEVILEATCTRYGKLQHRDRLFTINEPINSKEDIIDGMNRAFTKLEKELIRHLEKLSI